MKGIVFTEFLQMTEDQHGEHMVDEILEAAELDSGGAYTSVGTYDYTEFIILAHELAKKTGEHPEDVIKQCGRKFFFRFSEMMPEFFQEPENSFQFLESVDNTIHVEVKKLYPESLLPSFETHRRDKQHMDLIYISQRPLADFAEGLITGCAEFYNEEVVIKSEDNNTDEHYCRVFNLTRH